MESIDESLSYINKIVADLQDFAKPPKPIFEKVAVEKIIRAGTEGRDLGIFGEPRVNVLKLNLALDKKM